LNTVFVRLRCQQSKEISNHFHFSFKEKYVARWEENASIGLAEFQPIPPPEEEEALELEELEIEGLQKQEEEELEILQYLDQLEQVTARYFSR
jgi:hypothetical protein